MDTDAFFDQFQFVGDVPFMTSNAEPVRYAPHTVSSPRPTSLLHPPDLDADAIAHVLALSHVRPDQWRAGKVSCNWNVALAMYGVSRVWRNGVFNALRHTYGFEALQAHAFLDVLLGRRNVFLTGPAGSGKSYVIDCLRDALTQMGDARSRGGMAVLAPTGIAAVNVAGRTICSFCSMRPKLVDEGSYTKGGMLPVGFWPEAWPSAAHDESNVLEAKVVALGFECTVDGCERQGRFGRLCGSHSLEVTGVDANPPSSDDDDDTVEVEVSSIEQGRSLMVPMRSISVKHQCEKLRLIIIDEVSMADELLMRQFEHVIGDAIGNDRPFQRTVGRRHIQLVLVGDFAQLPPVYERGSIKELALRDGRLHKYLFQSPMWPELRLREHALTVVKRSAHPEYLQVLSELRDGEPLVGERLARLMAITRRRGPGDEEEDLALFGRNWPDRAVTDPERRSRYPCVVNWNERKMAELPTPPLHFPATSVPDPEDTTSWTPSMPPNSLMLKVGCTVMVTRNMWVTAPCGTGANEAPREEADGDDVEGDDVDVPSVDESVGGGDATPLHGHRVANGSIGTLVGVEGDGERLVLRFPDPKGVEGATFTVTIKQTEYHASRLRRRNECTRSCMLYKQNFTPQRIPHRHARGCPRRYFRATKHQFATTPSFGITIHKSQGQTLRQRFVVRIDQSWDAGQLYVGLSRASDPGLMRLAGNSSDAKRSKEMRQDILAVKNFHAQIARAPAHVV